MSCRARSRSGERRDERTRGAGTGACRGGCGERRRPGRGGARPRAERGRTLGPVRTPGGRGAPAATPGGEGRAGFRPAAARQGQEAARPSPRTPTPAPPRAAPAAASSRRPPSAPLGLGLGLRRGAGAGAGARGGARAERRPLRTCRARAQASTGRNSTRRCGRCLSGCRGCARWARAPTARSGRGGGEGGEGGEVRAGRSARPLPSLGEVPGVGRGLALPPPPGRSPIAGMNGGSGAGRRKLSYRTPLRVRERGRSPPVPAGAPPPGPNPAASQPAKGRVSRAPKCANRRPGCHPLPRQGLGSSGVCPVPRMGGFVCKRENPT